MFDPVSRSTANIISNIKGNLIVSKGHTISRPLVLDPLKTDTSHMKDFLGLRFVKTENENCPAQTGDEIYFYTLGNETSPIEKPLLKITSRCIDCAAPCSLSLIQKVLPQ